MKKLAYPKYNSHTANKSSVYFSFLAILFSGRVRMIDMTTVERIKKLCEAQKMTFAELERKIGLGNGAIRRWDTQNPASDKIILVANYFNVSVDYLLGRADIDPIEMDEDIRTLGRAAREMTPEQRAKAIKILSATFEDLFDE